MESRAVRDWQGPGKRYRDRVDIRGSWADDGLMLRALLFATLLFVSWGAGSGQELSVLHMEVVVVDAERKATPVALCSARMPPGHHNPGPIYRLFTARRDGGAGSTRTG